MPQPKQVLQVWGNCRDRHYIWIYVSPIAIICYRETRRCAGSRKVIFERRLSTPSGATVVTRRVHEGSYLILCVRVASLRRGIRSKRKRASQLRSPDWIAVQWLPHYCPRVEQRRTLDQTAGVYRSRTEHEHHRRIYYAPRILELASESTLERIPRNIDDEHQGSATRHAELELRISPGCVAFPRWSVGHSRRQFPADRG